MATKTHYSNLSKPEIESILTEVLEVKKPSDWILMIEEANVFSNKCNEVYGSPNFAFINEKSFAIKVLNYFPRLRYDDIYRAELNTAFIHAQLVLDTVQNYYYPHAKSVISTLVYADDEKFMVSLPNNYGIYMRNAAISLCQIKKQPCVRARELAHFMAHQRVFLVKKTTDQPVFLENNVPFPVE